MHLFDGRAVRMTTRLEGTLKREIEVDGDTYTLTISPDGFTLALKGHRKGHQLSWQALVSGEAALATALNASIGLAKSPTASLPSSPPSSSPPAPRPTARPSRRTSPPSSPALPPPTSPAFPASGKRRGKKP